MFGQMQTGAPMQGGAGKGGIQQPMGGAGKGGMNRGPGGNPQNNPAMNTSFIGQPTGINPGHGPSQMISTPVAPGGAPGANFQHLMQWLPKPNFGQQARPGYGGNIYNDMGRPDGFGGGNLTLPTPQPQEPVGGYINGQPAQWHYQAEALKKPAVNNAGLPTGGLLARLYGGG